MSSPMDDVPVTGGMNTASGNTAGNTSKKRDSQTVGYINVSLGGFRIGSIQVETAPFNFNPNPAHKAIVDLFSYDLSPEELKAEILELINQFGLEFTCQLAGVDKQVQPVVDFAAKFAGRSKRTIKS